MQLVNEKRAANFSILTMTCVFICPQDASVVVHNPPNTQSVELYFRGEKMAKVLNVSII